jgi:glycyl-tRNA synthetase beta chain
MKIMTDGGHLFKAEMAPDADSLVDQAHANYAGQIQSTDDSWKPALFEFLREREAHVFERRGHQADAVRAVARFWARPYQALRRVEALSAVRDSTDFKTLAVLFKRVKNITKDFDGQMTPDVQARLTEPAELSLLKEIDTRFPKVSQALTFDQYSEAVREMVALAAPVDRFFADVLVMSEDLGLRKARLTLLTMLRRTILNIADISEIVVDEVKQA